jgi:ubiquinone/menaquinone biosynthesis C-methylase UbiE
MDLDSIRQHWQDWARQYGTGLRATTKASSAKAMELDALSRALSAIEKLTEGDLRVLEVGCGNGQNCVNLLEAHPRASITGIDFIGEMIEAANTVKAEKGIPDKRLVFQIGNVLELSLPRASYDVIFTDRCLINLNSDILQHKAIAALAELLKSGGHLLMIENCRQTYDAQNQARELVGLPKRIPAEFNHFLDETTLLPFLPSVGLEVLHIEDFISLHDLVLYVLVPMVNGGNVDYEHPMVAAATSLNTSLSRLKPNSLGAFGQNRLYKCRKAK